MTWRSDAPQGAESAKVAFDIVEYMHGRVLDLGCGPAKVFPAPNIIGVDDNRDARIFGISARPDVFADCARLDMFADACVDTVFSSHLLEHIADHEAALREWWRVLRPGGYLVLYLPHRDHYPNVGMPHANPDHKHDFANADITAAMRTVAWRSGRGWTQLVDQVRAGGTEYSFLQVYRKHPDSDATSRCVEHAPQPKPEKSLGLVRLGAYGDALWISAILPALKRQGWHITLYTQHQGETALRHDPHIDRLIVQPEQIFGPGGLETSAIQTAYWQHCEAQHDKFVNLVGCVEQHLLPHPAHANFWLPTEQRRRLMRRNYLHAVHVWAGLPYDPDAARVRFYPSAEELAWALAERAKIDGPLVAIQPAGSSLPKFWPHVQKAIEQLDAAGVHTLVLGDLRGQEYSPPPRCRVIGTQWTIRQCFTIAALADVVIGTESAIVNSVAHEKPLKIVLLSHSAPENLTRDWFNTVAIVPEGLACYPCHRIHQDWSHCTVNQAAGSSACQAAATPEVVVGYALQWIRGELKEAA